MRIDKDWSYFQFKVGKYKPHQYYDFKKKKFIDEEGFAPYKPETKKLVWYVIVEDFNARKIVPLNIFEGSISFLEGLLEAKKKYKDDFLKFADAVRSSLLYSYWSKCEWEIVITGSLAAVDGEEIDRLCKEKEERIEKQGHFYLTNVCLNTSLKIDVFTQVMMNWDRFIDYVWNNKQLITKKKLGIE